MSPARSQRSLAAGRLAYLLTGDRDVAEDLVQDAFVRLSGRFVHLRDPRAFPAYLQRTIVNLARSRLRRLRVERSYVRSQAPPARGADPPEIEEADRLASALCSFELHTVVVDTGESTLADDGFEE